MNSSPAQLTILAVEPYYGGSHKAFLDGLISSSRHSFRLFTLPARKWKWRMRSSAINLVQWLRRERPHVDLICASDFLSMADFVGLAPEVAAIPKIVYFHENQLTYPEQYEEKRDYQFAFTNITTCLAADKIFFNSEYHRQSMIAEVGRFLKRMPDFVPENIAAAIEAKSDVLHVGCNLQACDDIPEPKKEGPPIIVWNHRWEHDKDPETFFDVLFDLDRAGLGFRLMVLGESFRSKPAIFEEAKGRLASRIIHFGRLPDRSAYLQALKQADIVVSTAIHEFFGIAIVEAIACGCFPLLPNCLSYPEIIPPELHSRQLYSNKKDLRNRLKLMLQNPAAVRGGNLRKEVDKFSWQNLTRQYDVAFEQAVNEQNDNF